MMLLDARRESKVKNGRRPRPGLLGGVHGEARARAEVVGVVLAFQARVLGQARGRVGRDDGDAARGGRARRARLGDKVLVVARQAAEPEEAGGLGGRCSTPHSYGNCFTRVGREGPRILDRVRATDPITRQITPMTARPTYPTKVAASIEDSGPLLGGGPPGARSIRLPFRD